MRRAGRAQEREAGTQPSVAVPGLLGGDATLPAGIRDALHEQPRGAGSAHDEAAHEDLGLVTLGAGSEGPRYIAQRAVDRAQAGSQSHVGAHAAVFGRAFGQPALLVATRHPHLPLAPVRQCRNRG